MQAISLTGCHPSAVGGKTLIEVWFEKVAQDYDILKIFECLAYYHVKEDKLDHRAKKAVFLDFNRDMKDYKLWIPKTRRLC